MSKANEHKFSKAKIGSPSCFCSALATLNSTGNWICCQPRDPCSFVKSDKKWQCEMKAVKGTQDIRLFTHRPKNYALVKASTVPAH